MLSICKHNYCLFGDRHNTRIQLCQTKTKTKITVKKINHGGIIGLFDTIYDNYIIFENYENYTAVYNGKLIVMNYLEDDYTEDFKFDRHKHHIFLKTNINTSVFINEIETGNNLFRYTVSDRFYGKQSPSGQHIMFHNSYEPIYHYIVPIETFLSLVTKCFDIQIFKKYKINVTDEFWKWATANAIYCVNGGYGFVNDEYMEVGSSCYQRMIIYNIDSKNVIDIWEYEIECSTKPYFVHGLFYIFLKTKILIVNEKQNSEIPNVYKIVHYNHESNLFVADDCSVYVVDTSNIVDFIEFKFVGDYEQDHHLVPHYIKIIIQCILSCDIIYDIVEEIYRQLLKLDPIISLVY